MAGRNFNQLFPPKPTFTEHELPDQTGRVYFITGGVSGIGLELCKILYGANATIYIATRSASKIMAAITQLKSLYPSSKGRLESLVLDLSDLTTIKPAAEIFLAKEPRLDVLVHNAGVMMPPKDRRSVQGHELQMGTNALGPFLLTRCLEERLRTTTRLEGVAKGSVRVIWVASMISLGAPRGGVVWDHEREAPKELGDSMADYMQSKVGCVFLAKQFSKQSENNDIISVSVNPGLVKTELQRHAPAAMGAVMGLIFKSSTYGAYSELFAACSPAITIDKSGSYIIPWGRFGCIPPDIVAGFEAPAMDEKSLAMKFWDWCEAQTVSYPIDCGWTTVLSVRRRSQ